MFVHATCILTKYFYNGRLLMFAFARALFSTAQQMYLAFGLYIMHLGYLIIFLFLVFRIFHRKINKDR
jgi:hypothetical protein